VKLRLFAVVLSVLSLTLFFWTSYQRGNDVKALDQLAARNCEQIESLKREFRTEAQDEFDNIARNARLLGIELTEELLDTAQQELNKTLFRFRAADC
jgi:hypothetical protein